MSDEPAASTSESAALPSAWGGQWTLFEFKGLPASSPITFNFEPRAEGGFQAEFRDPEGAVSFTGTLVQAGPSQMIASVQVIGQQGAWLILEFSEPVPGRLSIKALSQAAIAAYVTQKTVHGLIGDWDDGHLVASLTAATPALRAYLVANRQQIFAEPWGTLERRTP